MKLSVIIPVYNVAPYLRACLDSVCVAADRVGKRDQGTGNRCGVEVICVDDGSTDGSDAILDEYATRQSNNQTIPNQTILKVLHQQNAGVSAARNAALEVATGDWICFVDADDVINERLFEIYDLGIRTHADAELVAVDLMRFADGESPVWPETTLGWTTFDCRQRLTERVYSLNFCQCAHRASLIAGLRFGNLKIGEDRIFVSQVIERLHTAVVCDWIGYGYRQRAGSAYHSRTTARMLRDEIRHYAILTGMMLSSAKTYHPAITRRRGAWLLENFAEAFYGLAPVDRDQVWDDWLTEMDAVSGFEGVRPYMRMVMRMVVRTRSKVLARILIYGILWLKLHGVNRRLAITKK